MADKEQYVGAIQFAKMTGKYPPQIYKAVKEQGMPHKVDRNGKILIPVEAGKKWFEERAKTVKRGRPSRPSAVDGLGVDRESLLIWGRSGAPSVARVTYRSRHLIVGQRDGGSTVLFDPYSLAKKIREKKVKVVNAVEILELLIDHFRNTDQGMAADLLQRALELAKLGEPSAGEAAEAQVSAPQA